jgi:hypothetical protein
VREHTASILTWNRTGGWELLWCKNNSHCPSSFYFTPKNFKIVGWGSWNVSKDTWFTWHVSQVLMLWQNTWENQLKGGKISYGSQFQRFSPRVAVSIAMGVRWGRASWWIEAWQSRAAFVMAARK